MKHLWPIRCALLTGIVVALLSTLGCGGASTMPDFSFSGNSELAGQSGGASGTFELALKGNNGFNNPVTITFTGVPAGVSFSPAAPFAIKPGSYPLTVNTPSDVTPGVYTITIQGSSGNLRHTAPLTLIVA
jgi:hypothetical protein